MFYRAIPGSERFDWVLLSFNQVSLGFTVFDKVIPGLERFDLVLHSFNQVWLGLTVFYPVLQVNTGLYGIHRVFQGCIRFYCVLPSFTSSYWVKLGCTGLYWVILCWILLGSTKF